MSKVSSMVKRYQTIADVEKSDRGPVYVLNNLKGRHKGQLLLSIPKRNGNGSTLVRVPDTFVPIDLTAQVPRTDLLESSEFRSSASEMKRHIRILNPEYAEALLATSDARAEQTRIMNEAEAARAAVQSATLGEDANATVDDEADDLDDEVDLSKIKSAKEQRATVKEKVESKELKNVSAKLKGLVSRSIEDDQDNTTITNAIRRVGVESKDELLFLANAFKDKKPVIAYLRTLKNMVGLS